MGLWRYLTYPEYIYPYHAEDQSPLGLVYTVSSLFGHSPNIHCGPLYCNRAHITPEATQRLAGLRQSSSLTERVSSSRTATYGLSPVISVASVLACTDVPTRCRETGPHWRVGSVVGGGPRRAVPASHDQVDPLAAASPQQTAGGNGVKWNAKTTR